MDLSLPHYIWFALFAASFFGPKDRYRRLRRELASGAVFCFLGYGMFTPSRLYTSLFCVLLGVVVLLRTRAEEADTYSPSETPRTL